MRPPRSTTSRLRALTAALGASLALAAFACSFTLDEVAHDAADATTDGPLRNDGSVVGADGGICVPTGPERCGDGLDNDCNGLVDCQDPACLSAACPLPSGWTFALVDPNDNGRNCPSTFGAPQRADVFDVTAAGRCGCTCEPACLGFTVKQGPGTACTTPVSTIVPDAACSPATLAASVSVGVAATPTGTCGPGTPRPTPAPVNRGAVCASTATQGTCAGGLCAFGGVAACAAASGDLACPGGFPHKYLVSPVGAGQRLDTIDTRVCPPCACTATGTCSGSVIFYAGAGCSGGAIVPSTNGTCWQTTDAGVASYRYSFADNGCTQAGDAGTPLDGSVQLVDQEDAGLSLTTVCCSAP